MVAVTPGVWADWASRLALTEVQEHSANAANSTRGFLLFIYLVDDEVMLAIS